MGIDFKTFERVKLGDVADYERAKAGHVYPAGASILQISATKGQIGFLHHPSTVEAKYAVIIPQGGIDPRYFNYVMQKNVAWFMKRYKADINIQEKDIADFPIELHNGETQRAVAKMVMYLDDKHANVEAETSKLVELKQTMLAMLMV